MKFASPTARTTGTAAFTVDFATADGTAVAGVDYLASSGTLSFAAGQATQTVSVTVNGDTSFEPNDTFFVNLTNASNGGIILDMLCLGTILNDDAPREGGDISIGDVSLTEGVAGTKSATCTVSRSGTAAFTVDFATAGGTAGAGVD